MEDLNAPATKGDMVELKQRLDVLRSEVNHQYDDLKETLRDNETKLLQAFYSSAESNQKRLSAAEQESSVTKERLAIFEQRLTDLERRINFPQQPSQ